MRFCCLILICLGLCTFCHAKESTDKPYAGSSQPPLAPAEAQKKFVVPPGFEVRLFAAEPDVANPVAMSFDEKGRLWVVELYEYPNGAKPGAKGRDRVKVYWDTDGDGLADKNIVFCDGLSLATAVLVGNGGIYVGQAPDLYFYPIVSDGPDGPKAGERKKILTGFGLEDRHELLNSINKDHHRHHMAAYGGINIYQGNLFPEEYRGTVFMGNIHGNCIDHDKLTPDGASFSASDMRKKSDAGEWLEANDDWFRPVSEQVGPDGALWIMDWYDRYPCYQNSQAPDLDRSRGRIWRVVYTGDEKGKQISINPTGDLSKLSDEQLVELLSHPNIWQRRVAQRLLSERKTKAKDQLLALLQNGKSLEYRL